MKSLIKKHFIFLSLLVFLELHVNAQKKIFVRIRSIGSSTTIKGLYSGHTDSALIILSKQQIDTIYYLNIQQIKTRRSAGHNILLSSVAGAIAGTATGLITHKEPPPPDPNCQLCPIIDLVFGGYTTKGQDAVFGAIVGAAAGTAAGTIIGLAKRKETLIVAGDFQKWKIIKTRIEAWPVYISGK
jgi:hypothetical protein